MKILVASDSFKGSAGTMTVAENLEKGFLRVYAGAEFIKLPMADGGEGTVETLVEGTGGRYIEETVSGPLGDKTNAKYGVIQDTVAVIEMAQASGLVLIEESRRNPLITSTYGTGELIVSALEKGFKEIYIGIGGSATNDGGVGMAKALGYRFMDKDGHEIPEGGGGLEKLHRIDASGRNPLLDGAHITVMCDVDNPLYGEDGAAYTYGPQKGADKDMVRLLDKNLIHYSVIIRRDLKLDIAHIPGSGAAGGLGAGLMAFCGAELKPGIEMVMDMLHFDSLLETVDIVLTGEGRMDGQSLKGKVPVGVAGRAMKKGVPVVAVTGGIGEGAEVLYSVGIDLIVPIVDRPISLYEAMTGSEKLLLDTGERIGRIVLLG
ncbi:MAG: glycerate kinase, partial [Bacillota bacterium]